MSDLDAVLGRRVTETTTTSAIPVVATVPSSRKSFRSRPQPDDGKEKAARRASNVRAVLGESQSGEPVIPEDAEELDGASRDSSGLNLRDADEIEPRRAATAPKDETEKLLTPRAALVAPDVTPESMTEIDPSQVPGPAASSSFRISDLETEPAATAAPRAMPSSGEHQSNIAMNILLGRNRPQQGTQPAGDNNRPGAPSYESTMPAVTPITESAAEAMFSSPGQVDHLKENQPMPEHKQGDGRPIYAAFRRFVG